MQEGCRDGVVSPNTHPICTVYTSRKFRNKEARVMKQHHSAFVAIRTFWQHLWVRIVNSAHGEVHMKMDTISSLCKFILCRCCVDPCETPVTTMHYMWLCSTIQCVVYTYFVMKCANSATQALLALTQHCVFTLQHC